MKTQETTDLKNAKDNFKDFFKGDKKIKIIVIIGIIGILLLMLSELVPDTKKKTVQADSKNTGSYETTLEEKLTNIIGNISGAGKCKVMVTLENGIESVYASEEKISDDSDTGSNSNTEKKYSSEKKYIVIKASSGSEEALVVKEIQPKIRGVIVVCQGGEDPVVQQKIVEAVTSALDVSSSNVSIAKMAS